MPEQPRTRANERIRVPEVRVIGDDGEQIGVMPTREALEFARERGLDLVEVSPNARPPVCRIMDFGKYKYEQSKKTRAAKKKQHSVQTKEVKLRPKIDDHDFNFKVENARKFLQQHHKVKLTIMFRGREMAHTERGEELLNRVVEELGDEIQVEQRPKQEGRNMSMLVGPRSARGSAKPKREDAPSAQKEAPPAPAAAAKASPPEAKTPPAEVQTPPAAAKPEAAGEGREAEPAKSSKSS